MPSSSTTTSLDVAAAAAEEGGGAANIGGRVPDFSLPSSDGDGGKENLVKLSSFLGSKVLICFYRFEHFPGCACTIGLLVGKYKKLAWASNLKVIIIFQMDVANLRLGLTDGGGGPFECTFAQDCYPFVALADPEGKAASAFGVEDASKAKYARLPGSVKRNNPYRLPAEFLVDENGVLVDALRASKTSQSIAMDRVRSFLLHGKQHPSACSSRRSKGSMMTKIGSLSQQFHNRRTHSRIKTFQEDGVVETDQAAMGDCPILRVKRRGGSSFLTVSTDVSGNSIGSKEAAAAAAAARVGLHDDVETDEDLDDSCPFLSVRSRGGSSFLTISTDISTSIGSKEGAAGRRAEQHIVAETDQVLDDSPVSGVRRQGDGSFLTAIADISTSVESTEVAGRPAGRPSLERAGGVRNLRPAD